jgi:two-component system, OmpR family, sensor histidine kinase MprB
VSFRRRIAFTAAAAVAIAVALGSAAAYLVVRETLLGQIDASLRNAAAQAPPPAGEPVPGPERQRGVVVSQEAALEGPVVFKQFTTGDRAPAAGEGRERFGDPRAVRSVAEGEGDAFFSDEDVQGMHVRAYTFQAAPGLAGQVARSLTEVDAALGDLRLWLGIVAVAGIALAAFLGRLATRHAVRPVTELTEAAEHVARTRDLSRRIEGGGGDELARLATSFNTMLGALDDSRRAQRRLVADASHELRTPLTSLRTNLEVLGSRRELPAGDRERLRTDVVAQLEELTELVGDLVELARDDDPGDEPSETLRFDALVAGAVDRARRQTPSVSFAAELEPTLVTGTRRGLDRAVANLLDNAGKWSAAGGVVEVRLADGELSVRDHGPGIAAEDLPHVFDRFYRAPAARSRAGSGLGLAIVRHVTERHGGEVAAEPAPGGGALLRLVLPVSSDS